MYLSSLTEFVPRDGVSSIDVQKERDVENTLRKQGDEEYKTVELERERKRKKMVRSGVHLYSFITIT